MPNGELQHLTVQWLTSTLAGASALNDLRQHRDSGTRLRVRAPGMVQLEVARLGRFKLKKHESLPGFDISNSLQYSLTAG